MWSRRCVWLACMFALATAFPAGGADRVDAVRTGAESAESVGEAQVTGVDSARNPEPIFSPTIDLAVQKKLERAYSLAARRVAQQPSCRSMFDRLDADGVDMLTRTLYLPASKRSESVICGRASMAFTLVGESVTRLCRRFGEVSDEKAAVIVLHEALHYAGMDERPHDPTADMTPAQINSMVERSCRLRN